MQYYRLTTVVWGSQFTQNFLGVCLPSLLAPLNLPALRDFVLVKYRIYTTSEDAAVIRESQIFKLLRTVVDIEFDTSLLVASFSVTSDKYHIMNLCFADAIGNCNSDDGAWGWVHPDVVYASNCFSNIVPIMKSGVRLILVPSGFRTCGDSMLPILLGNHLSSNGVIAVSNRALVRLSVTYMTPYMKSLFFGSYNRVGFHWCVFWHVNEEEVLQRSYAPTPIFIYPDCKHEVPTWRGVSIEAADYLERAIPNIADVYIVKDTDIFYSCPLEVEAYSPPSHSTSGSMIRKYVKAPSVLGLALVNIDYIQSSYSRFYFSQIIRYRCGLDNVGENKEEWSAIEMQAAKLYASVLRAVKLIECYSFLLYIMRTLRRVEVICWAMWHFLIPYLKRVSRYEK